ncbi:MAG: DUF6452 family protein [Bacteroidales bacterium]
MNRWIFIFIAFLFLFTLIQCNDEPCDSVLETSVGISFHIIDTNDVQQSVSLSLLSVYALENDSIFADSLGNVSQITIPLDPSRESCIYVLDADSLQDTLTFLYDSDVEFVSQDCGFKSTFELNSVNHTYHFIDSVNIIQTTVNSTDANNLEIFLF